MEENVIISIKGSQLYEGQDPDVTELVTAGTLRREQEGYTIAYQETELTGLEGTTTKLRIEGPRVTLLRQGSVNSQMIFEGGTQASVHVRNPLWSVGGRDRNPTAEKYRG